MSAQKSTKVKQVIAKPSLTIIKCFSRFKVLTTFYPDLINFFKTMDGRYYEFALKCWSFPNENWNIFKLFFDKNNYSYKVIKAEKFVSINKTAKELHLKFGAFQENFDMFKEIEGVTYCRIISKYVMPLSALPQLEVILKDKKFLYVVETYDETDTSIGPECSESSESEEEEKEPTKKKMRKMSVEKEDQDCVEFVATAPINYAYMIPTTSKEKAKEDSEKEDEEEDVIETSTKKTRRRVRNKENDLHTID
jgi:hypothetical protein